MAHGGRAARVDRLPNCQQCGKKARYDAKTFSGPWAYLCDICWPQLRAVPDLGTGIGQYLYLEGELPPDWVLRGT